jgi:hypothetical protein
MIFPWFNPYKIAEMLHNKILATKFYDKCTKNIPPFVCAIIDFIIFILILVVCIIIVAVPLLLIFWIFGYI